MDRLMCPEREPYFQTVCGSETAIDWLTEEQRQVAQEIAQAVSRQIDWFVFRPGLAGTAKTFSVKAIVRELLRNGKRCLITGTAGISVVQ
jgi:late competence protein required for DNA uptake (superfamily II DNA/RNA helicase)